MKLDYNDYYSESAVEHKGDPNDDIQDDDYLEDYENVDANDGAYEDEANQEEYHQLGAPRREAVQFNEHKDISQGNPDEVLKDSYNEMVKEGNRISVRDFMDQSKDANNETGKR